METINIALPKGRLLEPSLDILRSAGIPVPESKEWGRAAVLDLSADGVKIFVIRDDDVPTYVAQGVADLGVVGKDVLLETGGEIFELFDLKQGFCRLVVAVPKEKQNDCLKSKSGSNRLRVVTKYPRITADYFRQTGVLAEIITVQGATELAPSVGLADIVVDVVASGRTLAENNLVEIEEIATCTARLVANPASYRLKGDIIWPLVENIRHIVENMSKAGENIENN